MQSSFHTQSDSYQSSPTSSASDLVRIGYIGHFKQAPGTSSLMTLYYETHKDCKDHGLTGLLICDGKKIGNVIEGSAPLVHDHLYKMQSDNRFHNICLFEMQPVASRLYDAWSMHIKDGFILSLMYPECAQSTHEINADSTEEILAIMYSYAALVRSTAH